MSQQELLSDVAAVLSKLGIECMLTGSVASSLHGEPRASHDIDLVINLPLAVVPALVQAFPPPRYYLSEQAVVSAVSAGSMFNLLRLDTGDKVDFWMLTADPFDQSRFARRRREIVLGLEVQVSSPEDTILMKLRWAQQSGGSEKQFNDAISVYEVQASRLDMDYLKRWAVQLGIQNLWQRLQSEADAS